jgi:urease accessory protein
MLRATTVKRLGDWSGQAVDVVVLSLDDRHRRRIKMSGVHGLVFLLDLSQATTLRGGDALVLEDGCLVEVVAAPEPLTEISSPDAATLIRLSWHLGNRHLPVQVLAHRLRIRRDAVIEAMLRHLGAVLIPIEAPFDPEGGAYGNDSPQSGQAHAHGGHSDHRHHGHALDHGPHDPTAPQHERTHIDPHPHLHALQHGEGEIAAARAGETGQPETPDQPKDHHSDERDGH